MNTFWDPLTGQVTNEEMERIEEKNKQIQSEYEKLKLNHKRFKLKLFLSIFFCFLTVLLVTRLILILNMPEEAQEFLIVIGWSSAIPIFFVLGKPFVLQRRMSSYIVANKFGWLCDPNKNTAKWKQLSSKYPEIFLFNNGGNQLLANQFWGILNDKRFWITNYLSSHGPNFLVHAFELPTTTITDLLIIQRVKGIPYPDELTTESNEFNKKFHIKFKGERELEGANIMQILAPDVQESLISFADTHNTVRILFRNNIVFIAFIDQLNLFNSNFLKTVSVDEKDEKIIIQNIQTVASLAKEILDSFEHVQKI
ncbi:hypothetical protein AUK11_03285 [bacterium CG2_30_37_16]|nr:MAG: hypothetical protein AUK11_03285 [bacterium CG2_30_37_16]PIP30992.1 MAG: hypothetical protein COX25_01725 [bacterium (Candidatus Howlettbacteria) CG23_combo_of_CG06-09_8_20_14_all_37_9]PJB06998.1 MAG: hypothetical protein CO123_00865 [bacterium (Candidatus Howlettbacteria) CG_4_9_14_3_um_filter_37_10]